MKFRSIALASLVFATSVSAFAAESASPTAKWKNGSTNPKDWSVCADFELSDYQGMLVDSAKDCQQFQAQLVDPSRKIILSMALLGEAMKFSFLRAQRLSEVSMANYEYTQAEASAQEAQCKVALDKLGIGEEAIRASEANPDATLGIVEYLRRPMQKAEIDLACPDVRAALLQIP